eukprot:PITA_19801
MDHILQRVFGASRMLLFDGYSGYNQILVHEDDRDKTTFTTPWGTFHYTKMSFGLKNAGETFQHAMDITFANENDVFLVVYLDDLTVFSNLDEEHLYHLKIVFQHCRKYGISLNPKKSLFAMDEGKLLDHIISKEGIRIDPARVEAIQKIDFPHKKKEIQAFNSKMNFLRRFVPNLAEHLREITNMLKKGSVVNRTIRDVALKYNIIEKQALTLVKDLKYFWAYILHSHILAYVPNATVKDVLVKTDLEGRWGKWIVALLEYDLEIKPTKLIKGKGLEKLMDESNLHALDINLIATMSKEVEDSSLIQVSEIFLHSPWYSDIVYVLQHLSRPPGMAKNKGITLKLKSARFCILNNVLYWKDPGGILLNFFTEEEAQHVMSDFHKGDCGGHLFWKRMANKILKAGYYWPTLFADVYKTVTGCHECQIFQGRRKLQPLPLKPVEVSAPFQKWGIYFIGEIHPTSSDQHKWILTTTDYFTKWIEAIPTRQATDSVIIQFLETNILSRFGYPNKLITNNVATFKSKKMIEFCSKYKIILGHSTAYYLQGNGLAESSNKSLVNIIKKLLETNKKSWQKKLVNALWADRVSQKKSLGMSPFEIVYSIDIVFSTSLVVLVVKLLQEAGSTEDHFQQRISQLIHLQQMREKVFQNTFRLQERIKKIYDQKEKVDKFQIEDIVLRWDARNEDKGKHGKFENLWKGPYRIAAYRG